MKNVIFTDSASDPSDACTGVLVFERVFIIFNYDLFCLFLNYKQIFLKKIGGLSKMTLNSIAICVFYLKEIQSKK